MDYKFTLNLPFTKFSMKASLFLKENLIIKFWNNNKFYLLQENRKKKFILNDGPPYANGDIHIGHSFNKILKDIVLKNKILAGYKVYFTPGWDCHGLPIELNVEKKFKNLKISHKDFRYFCKNYALNQIYIQKKSFMRLGLICNWHDIYKTIDKKFEISIINSFSRMISKGLIYNGFKPIYWCFDCSSALSESEIEYFNKTSFSSYVFFKLKNCFFSNYILKTKNLKKIGFIVWTTTLWTLPFNKGIALKKNSTYVLFSYLNIGYIVAFDLFFNIINKFSLKKVFILSFFNSSILDEAEVYHPFYNKKVKLFFADFVKLDSGTGVVHIAPAYGNDDYILGLKYNLNIENDIDNFGFYYNKVNFFPFIYIYDINLKIKKFLKLNNNLIFFNKIKHRYPYCWRHKTELIFRTTVQWFLNVCYKNFKKNIINFSNKINWIPSIGKKKIYSMINDRPDWCLSRQRMWGVPIILFIDKNKKLHPKTNLILEKSKYYIKKYGSDFWYNFDVFNLFYVDKKKYIKVIDVLDVWFDSSVVYSYISENYNLKIPFDLCIEGNDQYRGWFQVSMINSFITKKILPYKTIISHGFVLDKFNRKMSKSLNNVISPFDVIKKYGADILRLWVSSVNYCFDVNLSDEILLRVSEAYRKIRNTIRFCLSNLNHLKYSYFSNFFFNNLNPLDFFILYKFFLLKKSIYFDYSSYKFYNVYKKIYNFCINDFSIKYVDLVKDTLYTLNSFSIERISIQITLFLFLYELLKLISPILSHTSEEAWGYLPLKDNLSIFSTKNSISLKKFNIINFNILNCIFFDKLFFLKYYINKYIEYFRKLKLIGSSLELKLIIVCNLYWYNIISHYKKILNLIFGVSFVCFYNLKKKEGKYFKSNVMGVFINFSFLKKFKCDRCWNRYIGFYFYNKLLNICNKCIFNLYYF